MKKILLFGDKITDTYYLPLERTGSHETRDRDWENHRQWRHFSMPGGVEMSRTMLEHFDKEVEVTLIDSGGATLESLALLQHCKIDPKTGQPTKFDTALVGHDVEKSALRVERSLGYRSKTAASGSGVTPAGAIPSYEILVINDGGNSLRHDTGPAIGQLGTALSEASAERQVVLKMHLPLAKGAVWAAFANASSAGRRILILHSDDLRQAGPTIARCPCWDAVVEDLTTAAADHAGIRTMLAGCDAMIVLFGVEGAVLLEPVLSSGHSPDAQVTVQSVGIGLFCDPIRAEGEVARKLPGDMVGKMNAFMAAFVAKLPAPSEPLDDAMIAALETARAFAEGSYAEENNGVKLRALPKMQADWRERQGNVKPEEGPARYIKIRPTTDAPVDLLRDALMGDQTEGIDDIVFKKAKEIVLKSAASVLSDLPHGRFGRLYTVDRQEIGSLRAIDSLIQNYLADLSRSTPISFGVFGPPGAGKSFGVKQLVDPDRVPILDFNLSQASEDQLPIFFQQIRDSNLKNKTPLCFFDEFDSVGRRLIKNFLAPMQDGAYRDGDSVRPIGRGIFVFAGGTADTFEEFAGTGTPPPSEVQKGTAKNDKVPDFISRLSGVLNVSGVGGSTAGDQTGTALLHRALLLRALLERVLPEITPDKGEAAITDDLVSKMLRDWQFSHGARSMETVLRAMAAHRQTPVLGLSDLPIQTQLAIHVAV